MFSKKLVSLNNVSGLGERRLPHRLCHELPPPPFGSLFHLVSRTFLMFDLKHIQEFPGGLAVKDSVTSLL